MKKFALILLTLVLIFSFAGVSSAKNLNIAFLAFGDISESPYYREIFSGVQAFVNSHPGSKVKVFQGANYNASNIRKAMRQAVKDSDVVIYSYSVSPEITEFAQVNPKIKFLFIEEWPINKNGKNIELPNVFAMRFKEDEAGFLAGLAAALSSKTKKVAVVNGVVMPSNLRFQHGFNAGVNYANEKYNTNVQNIALEEFGGLDRKGKNVGGNYVGSFTNTAKAKVIGQSLVDAGCDVIFISASEAGNGIIALAKESGKLKLIGCDTDQFDPDSNVILTSVVKLNAPQILTTLNDINSGHFRSGNYLLGAGSHAIGFVKGEHCLLDSDIVSKLDSALELMKAGELITH